MIPKIIHQIWIGNKKFPEIFRLYGKTWKKKHPNWEYRFWNNDNIPELLYQDLFDEATEIVLKANILRVELLYKYGGVYIDTDFECYKNIEPLIFNKDIDIFSCGEEDGIIGNAIMGSVPGHKTWEKVMSGWEYSLRKNANYPPSMRAGVVYMTKTLDNNKDITMLPSKYFFPVPTEVQMPMGMEYYFPEAYGMHHWAASWVTDKTIKQWEEWDKINSKNGKWYKKNKIK